MTDARSALRDILDRVPVGPGHGVLSAEGVRDLYQRLAPGYDTAAAIAGPLGVRRLGRTGIEHLDLAPGATVVELGCGTGAHLPDLVRAVGPSGRVVAVDLTAAMLERARRRMRDHAGARVDFVQADLREVTLPDETSGVLSTFAMEMVPEHDDVIARAVATLRPNGGRIALSGLREPADWPRWATRLGVALTRPFGVTTDYFDIRPWASLRRHADEVLHREILGGAVYLSVGAASTVAPA